MNTFVDRHWSDLVAMLIVTAGVCLVVAGRDDVTRRMGESMLAAGFIALRLVSNAAAVKES